MPGAAASSSAGKVLVGDDQPAARLDARRGRSLAARRGRAPGRGPGGRSAGVLARERAGPASPGGTRPRRGAATPRPPATATGGPSAARSPCSADSSALRRPGPFGVGHQHDREPADRGADRARPEPPRQPRGDAVQQLLRRARPRRARRRGPPAGRPRRRRPPPARAGAPSPRRSRPSAPPRRPPPAPGRAAAAAGAGAGAGSRPRPRTAPRRSRRPTRPRSRRCRRTSPRRGRRARRRGSRPGCPASTKRRQATRAPTR